jgi:alpha-tubulin suppressor-like RCC1 family protein
MLNIHLTLVFLIRLVENEIKIMQISAGVDVSMAVSTTGKVYGWGNTKDGRIGVKNTETDFVRLPHEVNIMNSNGEELKAVDVEAGYVHSMIVCIDGTVLMCGEVESDGGKEPFVQDSNIKPSQLPDFNIWHRLPQPKEVIEKAEKWKKYGKYELKGRSAMVAHKDKYNN